MVRGCLSLGDVLLSGDLITISFQRFKHSAQQGPQSLQVTGEGIPGTEIYLPSFLREFLLVMGAVPAPLFAYPDSNVTF